MPSTRQSIIEAFKARAQTINGAGDFVTSAGALVLLGEAPNLGPDDPDDAIILVVDDDVVTAQPGGKFTIALPIIVGIVTKASLAEPWVRIEAGIADIKRAIEIADRTLGVGQVRPRIERGTTKVLERSAGSAIVGAGITYTVPYEEAWGLP